MGSKLAHSSPTLIAACHVLHRLCMPRHSPNALTSHLRVHTTNDKPERSEDRQDCACDADDCFHSQPVLINALIVMIRSMANHLFRSIEPARHRLKNPFTMSKCRWTRPKPRQNPSEDGNLCLHSWNVKSRNGGAYRDRTDDLMLAKQPLSQLS